MNCQSRSLCVVVIAGLVLFSATQAGAQPAHEQAGAPPPANERMLVVDVSSGRESEQYLAQELGTHLRRSGLTVIEGALSDSGRACDSTPCMEPLARRENVGFVLYAQVQQGAPSSFAVTMTIFDAVRHTPLQAKGLCTLCNAALLSIKINDLADQLIRDCREARVSSPDQNQTSNPPAVPPGSGQPDAGNNSHLTFDLKPPARGFFAELSPIRKITAAVLGGLAGAVLISSIALTVTNGKDTTLGCEQRMDVLQDKCILKNTPLFAAGYALTGALVVGVGFTLFWPKKSPRSTPRRVR